MQLQETAFSLVVIRDQCKVTSLSCFLEFFISSEAVLRGRVLGGYNSLSARRAMPYLEKYFLCF